MACCAVGGGADDLDAGDQAEQGDQAFPDGGLVVGDEDPQGGGWAASGGCMCLAGRRSTDGPGAAVGSGVEGAAEQFGAFPQPGQPVPAAGRRQSVRGRAVAVSLTVDGVDGGVSVTVRTVASSE